MWNCNGSASRASPERRVLHIVIQFSAAGERVYWLGKRVEVARDRPGAITTPRPETDPVIRKPP